MSTTTHYPERYWAAALRFRDQSMAVRFYRAKFRVHAMRAAKNGNLVEHVGELREITKAQYERATAQRTHDCSRRNRTAA